MKVKLVTDGGYTPVGRSTMVGMVVEATEFTAPAGHTLYAVTEGELRKQGVSVCPKMDDLQTWNFLPDEIEIYKPSRWTKFVDFVKSMF